MSQLEQAAMGALTRVEADIHHVRGAGQTNVRETIESILIAFILAFVFRVFVVEPFVIPTGSMAPTLLGANMRFTCPDCGYTFEVGYPTSNDSDDTSVPRNATVERGPQAGRPRTFAVTCPNCGFKLPRQDGDVAESGTASPPVRYGDRILVLKYQYLFQEPQRWDVVVFKAPPEPAKYDYSVNYIKRLVGKPGEKVLVLDGEVYIAPPERSGNSLDDYQVQTKPRAAQEALWRLVYNNDYYPRGLDRDIVDPVTNSTSPQPAWQQPWTPDGGAGWIVKPDAPAVAAGDSTEIGRRVFRFENANGSGALRFDPHANPRTNALTDFIGYDATEPQHDMVADQYNSDAQMPINGNVSDLKLAFNYDRLAGDGPLDVEMSKLGVYFIVELSRDHVTLRMRHPGRDSSELAKCELPAPGPSPLRIEISNVDYRVTVRINDQDLIQTTPAQYHPNMRALMAAFVARQASPMPTVRIEASRQSANVSHVGLWRDVYYTNRSGNSSSQMMRALPDDFPNNVARLGAKEYFVMGDNSAVSFDARFWADPIDLPVEEFRAPAGCVPERFLLGKAFFVYWPAGYRPMDFAPGVVPDFGDMRFIH
jgi:signal peptidase I